MTTKRELLELEVKVWDELSARFARIRDWDAPGATGDWTPKDVMAHVASWHAIAVDLLEVFSTTGEIGRPGVEVDERNRRLYEDCKDLSLHDVRVMSGSCRHRFREEVARLAEPLPERIANIVAANAHGHYEEHIPLLDAFLVASR